MLRELLSGFIFIGVVDYGHLSVTHCCVVFFFELLHESVNHDLKKQHKEESQERPTAHRLPTYIYIYSHSFTFREWIKSERHIAAQERVLPRSI
jgi:hypothetical protein